MIRLLGVCFVLLLLPAFSPAKEYPPAEAVLFDFEKGAEGWAGNAWKGGECRFEATDDARFGKRALRGWYEGEPKKDGGNIICPELPEDAAWRKGQWGAISLWLKGDGSASRLRLILQEEAKEHPTFSAAVPLDSKKWRRFSLPFRTFWNRGKRTIDPAKLSRLYFGGTPNQSFTVDRIALEAPHRQVPLEAAGGKAALPFHEPAVVEYEPGRYGVRLSPADNSPEQSAAVVVTLVAEGGATTEDRVDMSLGQASPEVLLPLTVPLKQDAKLTLTVMANGASGKQYRADFRFPAFVRKEFPLSPGMTICPLPKEMSLEDGHFALDKRTTIAVPASSGEEMGYCSDMLQREIAKWYGLDLRVVTKVSTQNTIVLTIADVDLPEEGYALDVTPRRVEIRAGNCRALYYGIQTLLQAIAVSTEAPCEPRVRCVKIKDWPSLPMRSAMICLPTRKWGHPNDPDVPVEDFLDFLYNTLARHKYNTLILNTGDGCRYACAPKVGAKHAWGRAELERVREFCKRNFLEIIPNVNSMGHTGWLLLGYPECRWHDDLNMLCTCNPKSYQLMTSVYDELIDIFHPRAFHIGMDEVRWRGGRRPEKIKPCGCDDLPTWEQFGRWVKKMHGHLAKRGVRTMMWGDMLLVEHNGGPPFFTKRALPDVPRDTMIANWSSSLAATSDFFFNKQCGFATVIESNSSGVNVRNSPYLAGNMFGMWSKTPWISQRDKPGTQRYCYLGLVQAGEFSWNLNRTGRDVTKRYDPDYFKSRESSVLKSLGLLPEPRAGKTMKPVDLGLGAKEPVSVSGVAFDLPREGKCIELAAGKPRAVPFGGRAASLYFLHAETLPTDPARLKSFQDELEKVENVRGIPVGSYEMVYDDGSTAALAVVHSRNILPQRMFRTLPYAYRVIGSHRLPGDVPAQSNALYAAQWVNPHPQKKISEIRLVGGSSESKVCLFGVTARMVAGE